MDYNRELINNIGEFIKYWGFKSIHGKIWAYIYLSKEPRTTQEIIDEFDFSKAAVSLAIKTLMEHHLIKRVEKIEFGTYLYEAVADIKKPILGVLKMREKEMLNKIIQLSELAKNQDNDEFNSKQSKKILKMTKYALTFLDKFVFSAISKLKI